MIQKWIYVVFLNLCSSFLLVFLLKLFQYQFDLDTFINWGQTYTKYMLLSIVVTFLIFLVTSKYQLLLAKKIFKRYPWARHVLRGTFFVLFTLFLCFVATLSIEFFQKGRDVGDTIDWLLKYTKVFFISTSFFIFLALFFLAVFGNFYLGLILLNLVALVLGIVQFNKIKFLQEPIYPSDFKQIAQFQDVLKMTAGYFSIWTIVFTVVSVLVLIIIIKVLPKIKLSLWLRGVFLGISIFMIYSYVNYPKTFMKEAVASTGIKVIQWDPLRNYNENSFVFGFISNLNVDVFDEPDNYEKSTVLEVASKYAKDETNHTENDSKPNIIFIMNETFWDPTVLENVSFSEDPIKNVRGYMDEYTSGSILSPQFGGGTSNVEFEALTGMSMSFLKAGAIPYQQLIENKQYVPSIVGLLKQANYETIAIHPYHSFYYKRKTVYNILGFDEFISIDDLKYNEKSGLYISDESVTKEIIDTFESSDQPLFIHAVTMQNHFPYQSGRYPENRVSVSGLSEENKIALEVFTEGVMQSDEATKQLLDYLDESNEPTVVVFWGDHLPILGDDKGLYKEAKFVDFNDPNDENKRLYETPFFIYSNFEMNQEKYNTLSPAFISSTLFKLLDYELPPYYQLLEKVKNMTPGLKGNIKLNNEGEVIESLTPEQQELLNDYRLLQYDLLIGKQYSRELLYSE